MACRRAGSWIAILLSITAFLSCRPPHYEKELNPRVLFGPGSFFLQESSTIAIKGSLEYMNSQGTESASFELFMNGPDTSIFFVTGSLGTDILTSITFGDSTAIRVRGWGDFRIFGKDDMLSIAEAGFDKISPFAISFILFPQYFYGSIPKGFDFIADTLRFNEQKYYFSAQTPNKFSITSLDPFFRAAYFERKKIGSGFYPSRILIEDGLRQWQMRINIRKIVQNKTLPLVKWRHF